MQPPVMQLQSAALHDSRDRLTWQKPLLFGEFSNKHSSYPKTVTTMTFSSYYKAAQCHRTENRGLT